MCFTLQRYKFSSKSQRDFSGTLNSMGCVLPCKGTNFQANHNRLWAIRVNDTDVFYLAKVQIFKQITTQAINLRRVPLMCFTLQRYKFSSKSQPRQLGLKKDMRCVLPCKGTNFQANHNTLVVYSSIKQDVFYLAKVQIFK